MEADDSNYLISEGRLGRVMFVHAVNEIALGIPFERVLERYNLTKKAKLNVIDRRLSTQQLGARPEVLL
jgi:hypothetical protein